MSFGIPVRNGLSISLLSTTALSSGRGYNTSLALNLDFLTGTLDPRITFSRGSQATLVDATGKLTYAPNNLLLNSETFEAASWTVDNGGGFNPVVTANAGVAPNGTTTADRVVLNRGTGTFSRLAQSVISVPSVSYIFSVWMRTFSGGSANVGLRLDTTGINCAVTGTWQRFFVSAPATVGTISGQILSFTSIPGTDATADILVWGAQLEAVTYQTTPGTYNSTSPKNLLGYTQEFDNAAWTKSNAFVQTNLLTYSEQFDNAAWTKNAVTVTANSIIAPDGTVTADTLTGNGASSDHNIVQTGTAAGTARTFSAYIKAGTNNFVQLFFDGDAGPWANYNLSTGVIGSTGSNQTATITPAGNGWYRCVIYSASTATTNPRICLVSSATASRAETNSLATTLYLWGAQLVQGSTAGDYQRTDAAAAAVQYTAPDGSRTADKLVETTAAGTHTVSLTGVTVAGAPFTASMYVKAAERSWTVVQLQSGTWAYINLSTGAVGTTSGSPTVSVVDAGGGWWRVSITAAASGASASVTAYLATANGTIYYTGDGTSGIYVWGAQLSNSASLDAYSYNPVAAPTSAAYYGPRFDYDPIRLTPKGLLIEETRINYICYSEDFTQADWQKLVFGAGSLPVVTPNYETAPNGLNSATRIQLNAGPNGSGDYSVLRQSGIGPGGTVSRGIWAKSNTGTNQVVAIVATNAATKVTIAPTWQRIILPNSAAGPQQFDISVGGTAATPATADISIWGAQLEAGSFATSYIPTVASQVTRTADVALMQGANFSNWYNQNEGTFVTRSDQYSITSPNNQWIFAATDGTSNNYVGALTNPSSYRAVVAIGGVTQASMINGTVSANTAFTGAIAYKTNDFAATSNGAVVVTDTSGSVPALSALSIGAIVGSNFINGHLIALEYFNTRLSNTALPTVTAPNTIPSLSLDFTTQVFNVG